MSERYQFKDGEPSMYGQITALVDTQTGREVLEDVHCNETPEDASLYRHFRPLLDELNRMARENAELRRALDHERTINEQMARRLAPNLAEAGFTLEAVLSTIVGRLRAWEPIAEAVMRLGFARRAVRVEIVEYGRASVTAIAAQACADGDVKGIADRIVSELDEALEEGSTLLGKAGG